MYFSLHWLRVFLENLDFLSSSGEPIARMRHYREKFAKTAADWTKREGFPREDNPQKNLATSPRPHLTQKGNCRDNATLGGLQANGRIIIQVRQQSQLFHTILIDVSSVTGSSCFTLSSSKKEQMRALFANGL